MQMMSTGLETAAGNKMKTILEKLTSNRIMGVIAGAVITAVIQSSSATTVMVVGFVNSGLMTLQQAVWVIMGANIGTTITGQLIALDIGVLAPLLAFIGVACIMFVKKEKVKHISEVIAGFGVLFIGMDMMGSAMVPLQSSEVFINFMTSLSNPLAGIAIGAIFTAIIQSSSASVGILQALAMAGLVPLHSAGIYWYKDKRKAHHDHSPDVQYYWICSVYDHFDRHTVCGYYGDNSTGEPGGPDCKCAYNL